MKLQYCSDLHLEFPDNKNFIIKNPLAIEGEILLLAGDIIPLSRLDQVQDFIDFISGNFNTVYWVPGNHEYYGYDIKYTDGKVYEEIRKNVFLVNNFKTTINDVNLLFTTLWGKIGERHMWEIQRSVSDFSRIKINGHRFLPEDYNILHNDCRRFLGAALKDSRDNKTIVVTHHVPTLLNYPEEYRSDPLNEAFAVEMFDFIDASEVNWWIYGHHHWNIPEFSIGRTHLVTNQVGYVGRGEHKDFRRGAVIEV